VPKYGAWRLIREVHAVSHKPANRARARRPYAWLGAGAVTLGLGAAMVGGTAVAFADPGTDQANPTGAQSAQATESPAKKATPRASRGAAQDGSGTTSARSPRRGQAAAVDRGEVVAFAETAGSAETVAEAPTPLAALTSPRAAASFAPSTAARKRPVATAAVASAALASAAASVPAAAADPSYNMDSYLPAEPIVPGASVDLAQLQISQAQVALEAQTWGSGNIGAGVASIAPQLFLAQASWALTAWEQNMPGASQAIATTVNIPIIHQLTQVNLVVTMTLPTLAQAGLTGAALLLPLVNLLGASTAATQALVGQARSNGQVYAVIPVQMKAVTEPVVSLSINGGRRTPILVDTGSSGLLVTSDSVDMTNLGAPVGTGDVIFSGDLNTTFHYTTYRTTVDFGGGVVTGLTEVNIVDDEWTDPDTGDVYYDADAFRDFLEPARVVGILGAGANTYGPGPSVPMTALPGELGDGFLLNQSLFLGLGGVMILGPNPLPNRVVVPGAPDAYVQVSVNDGPKQDVDAIIDSGGVYGTLPAYLIGGGDKVPAGTKISVYTADGQTLLYSYTVVGGYAAPTVVPDNFLMNTGYIPFQQGPVYIDFSYPGRIGSTNFVYA